MPLKIQVAHDFNCPWCWIGLSQARRLKSEFDVEIDWLGYELYPEGLDWPDPRPPSARSDRPPTPSRFDLALAAEGLPTLTSLRPSQMRTHPAHEAVEFAREHGVMEVVLERLYEAHWLDGADLSDPGSVVRLCHALVPDQEGLREAMATRRFAERIVPFDDAAHATGVYNVPTFFVGGERLAEQPYTVLRDAVARVAHARVAPAWGGLAFPAAPPERPYILINMVATLDGKILSGSRDENVMDLGSEVDHATLRYLESLAQGVMVGAGTLRATPLMWFPSHLARFVVSASGALDPEARFFTDDPKRAWVLGTRSLEGVHTRELGDWEETFKWMRNDLGISRLIVEGGSELNADLLRTDLVDEIFLTLAPKIRLGRDIPTLAGGDAFSREELTGWRLVGHRAVRDELFLRYQRDHAEKTSQAD